MPICRVLNSKEQRFGRHRVDAYLFIGVDISHTMGVSRMGGLIFYQHICDGAFGNIIRINNC